MSTLSNYFSHATEADMPSRASEAREGFWKRVLVALMRSREAQAKREADRYLARQSDRFLIDIGMTEADILALRKSTHV